ncbi:hypothetical protein [Yoonia sp.]|uniref:hypothetical protein n=1 Tax=Yoonia sp. TaxID=2212373 RepID=UPI003918BF59
MAVENRYGPDRAATRQNDKDAVLCLQFAARRVKHRGADRPRTIVCRDGRANLY